MESKESEAVKLFANTTRKNFIVNSILRKNVKKVGIYRLIMKTDSDNFRDSAVSDIIDKLKNNGLTITIYEPLLKESVFKEVLVIRNLKQFIEESDLIIANRMSHELESVVDKVYTRDVFSNN